MNISKKKQKRRGTHRLAWSLLGDPRFGWPPSTPLAQLCHLPEGHPSCTDRGKGTGGVPHPVSRAASSRSRQRVPNGGLLTRRWIVTGAGPWGTELSRENGSTSGNDRLGPPQLLVTIHDSELQEKHETTLRDKTDTSLYSTLYSTTNLKEFSAQTKFSRELEKTLLPASSKRKRGRQRVCMSQGIVGRTMEGAIACVCKFLAILPAGIGIMQM